MLPLGLLVGGLKECRKRHCVSTTLIGRRFSTPKGMKQFSTPNKVPLWIAIIFTGDIIRAFTVNVTQMYLPASNVGKLITCPHHAAQDHTYTNFVTADNGWR